MADMEFLLSERELAGATFAQEKKQVSAAELWWLRSPGRDAEWYRDNVTPYYGPLGTLPAMGRYKYVNQEGASAVREYRRVTACPICGGKLVVQEFYTFTREYAVTKKGLLSNRYTVSDGGPIDCINAYCSSCGKVWGADEVCVESSGEVFIKMEAGENHVSD